MDVEALKEENQTLRHLLRIACGVISIIECANEKLVPLMKDEHLRVGAKVPAWAEITCSMFLSNTEETRKVLEE